MGREIYHRKAFQVAQCWEKKVGCFCILGQRVTVFSNRKTGKLGFEKRNLLHFSEIWFSASLSKKLFENFFDKTAAKNMKGDGICFVFCSLKKTVVNYDGVVKISWIYFFFLSPCAQKHTIWKSYLSRRLLLKWLNFFLPLTQHPATLNVNWLCVQALLKM